MNCKRDMNESRSAWRKVRLGDLGEMSRGCGIKRDQTVSSGRPCLRYGEIYTSYNIELDKPRSFVSEELFSRSPHILKGDLVIALTGENKEDIAKTLAYLGNEEVAAGGDMAVWTNHGCDPLFLSYLMSSPRLAKAKADASNGHIVVHASVKKLQQIEVEIPDLAEQHKIVSFVRRRMDRVDAIENQLLRLKDLGSNFLKSAMEEAFTPLYAQTQTIADLCQSMSVGIVVRPTRYYTKDGTRAFRNTNIRPCYVRDADWVCVNQQAVVENPRCEVRSGDVAIARSGLPGVAAVVEPAQDRYAAIDILILRPDKRKIDSHFLAYFINTRASQGRIKGMRNGVAQSHVGLTSIAKLPVKVPSLPMQRKIVEWLDGAKMRSEKFVALAERGLRNCAQMRRAILAEAFR